jgi:hypothetical protein
VALLDDVDANAIGSDDLLAACVHGREVWLILDIRALGIYAVYNELSCWRLLICDGARDGTRLMGGRSYPHRLTIDVEPEVYEALRVHAFRERTNVAELVRQMGRRLLTEDRSLAREVRERLDGSTSRRSDGRIR